jgi:hypothetical protein
MRRGLQAVLAVGGVVAIGTGLVHIVGGVSTFPGSPSAENAADNEARFLAAFWVAFGAVALWVVPRVELRPWSSGRSAPPSFWAGWRASSRSSTSASPTRFSTC